MGLKHIIEIILKATGARQVAGEMKVAEDQTSRFASVIGKLALTLGVAFSAKAIISSFTQTAAALDQVQQVASRLDVSVNFLKEMEYVALRVNVQAGVLETSFRDLTRRSREFAQTGGGEAADVFKRLGIEVRTASGGIKTAEELLPELQGRITNVADAMNVFGRGGAEMVQILKLSSAEVQFLKSRFKDLHGEISEKALADAAAYADSVDDMKKAWEGLRVELAIGFLPVAKLVADALVAITKAQRESISVTRPSAMLESLMSPEAAEMHRRFGGAGAQGITTGPMPPAAPAAEAETPEQAKARLELAKQQTAALLQQRFGYDVVGEGAARLVEHLGNLNRSSLEQMTTGERHLELTDRQVESLTKWRLEQEATVPALQAVTLTTEEQTQVISEWISKMSDAEQKQILLGGATDLLAGSMSAFSTTLIRGGNIAKIRFGDVITNVLAGVADAIERVIARAVVMNTVLGATGPAGFGNLFFNALPLGPPPMGSNFNKATSYREIWRSREFHRAMRDSQRYGGF